MVDQYKESNKGLPRQVVLASGNPHKIKDYGCLFSEIFEVHAQEEYFTGKVDEKGLSFVENALIKARYAAERSGLAAIGDDSGLMVAVLHDAPGIYSGRYAGEDASDQENVDKLLYVLRAVPRNRRQARYFCALSYIRHAYDLTPAFAVAELHGEILDQPQGDSGYDSIFYLPEMGCSVAELSEEQRLTIGNRAMAVKRLMPQITG